MTGASGWEVLADQLCDRVREEVEGFAGEARYGTGPESFLLTSIMMAAAFAQPQHDRVQEIADASALFPASDRYRLFFQRRAPFQGSPSKLVFYCWNHRPQIGAIGWHSLLVECASASVGAFASTRDVSAICFDTKEIWSDPLGCALSIFDWASERWP